MKSEQLVEKHSALRKGRISSLLIMFSNPNDKKYVCIFCGDQLLYLINSYFNKLYYVDAIIQFNTPQIKSSMTAGAGRLLYQTAWLFISSLDKVAAECILYSSMYTHTYTHTFSKRFFPMCMNNWCEVSLSHARVNIHHQHLATSQQAATRKSSGYC